ncbi:hypothetical protein P175DRAFT_0524143 [Aspergillus ochraceoroseus IBT 24754]|uniref:BTB domain-containing protein n=1 Tax=Aspergillus ochraceoroseus IBT 24754 TaxID=1392256 RepID=A0A2T5LU67_9EURO|nr:uncharacterized protein P175DRAFT_0524143 [Aspergillus ochraceoroseus IBT 24754]PTU19813.1 hypothetical protein P175DRAFT_0524143 [Aspergillus ochraceoroseus IBT 24754]
MGPFKEASSGVYEMNDDPLPMVKNLVDYLYTLDYNENLRTLNQECPSPISGLQVHARMFALADKYDIKALQVLSSEKYSNMLESSSIGSEFLGSIPDVYTLTPPSVKALRDKVARFARINLENYLQDPSSREVYKRIAIDVPDFLQDLLDLYIMNPLTGFCYRCNPLSTMQALQTPCHKCGLSGICYDSE